jgi:hypothetical protein
VEGQPFVAWIWGSSTECFGPTPAGWCGRLTRSGAVVDPNALVDALVPRSQVESTESLIETMYIRSLMPLMSKRARQQEILARVNPRWNEDFGLQVIRILPDPLGLLQYVYRASMTEPWRMFI